MLPKEDRNAIYKELGLQDNDKHRVRFYMHKVIDTEATMQAAMDEITAKAIEKTAERQAHWKKEIARAEQLGLPTVKLLESLVECEVIPDYSIDNLKRHGAKSVYKTVPYVEIQKIGNKDFRSYAVTDEHKQRFAKQWAKFEAENEDIRERRDTVRTETSGQQNDTPSSNWQGGVSYNPTPYKVTFG